MTEVKVRVSTFFHIILFNYKRMLGQGSRGRRIRRPGTKKIGLGRMVLLRDDSTDARFFRREASQNFRYFTLVLMFICHRVSVTSQDNCFQSLVYIFAPPRLNYVTGILTDQGNEACSHFDKQINLTPDHRGPIKTASSS